MLTRTPSKKPPNKLPIHRSLKDISAYKLTYSSPYHLEQTSGKALRRSYNDIQKDALHQRISQRAGKIPGSPSSSSVKFRADPMSKKIGNFK